MKFSHKGTFMTLIAPVWLHHFVFLLHIIYSNIKFNNFCKGSSWFATKWLHNYVFYYILFVKISNIKTFVNAVFWLGVYFIKMSNMTTFVKQFFLLEV